MDAAWWRIHIDEVKAAFAGQLLTSAAHCFGATRIGTDEFPNSGAGAIASAVRFGAKRIILLGYDCQHTNGKTHWHGKHPAGLGDAGTVERWPGHFKALAKRLDGVKVVNCSRETALTCFPRADLGKTLDEARKRVVVRGMRGLGDCIYQRAFIRRLDADVYLDTPWPELFADLRNVQCVKPETRLRTQRKNARSSAYQWAAEPRDAPVLCVGYGHRELRVGSIPSAMARQFGVSDPVFDLPDFGPSPIRSRKPVAIVRPVTARKEWLNTARNPKPEYVAKAAAELRERGYYVVSLADLEAGEEWIVGNPPPADLVWHRGELNVAQMLAAVQQAAVVVGGVGWIVPACISAKVPLYCILGGNLGHNAPEKITDSRMMGLSRVGWAWPDRPCRCTDMQHDCKKEISGFEEKFSRWLDEMGL